MAGTLSLGTVSTKLQRIAQLARNAPDMVFTSLAHHIDIELLREAHRRTRKDASPGVDGQTAADFAANLEENLAGLLRKLKSGSYNAPPVRRAHIPKGAGKTRPIGIPTFEDKVLQRAVTMIIEAVYEEDFLPCSFGFRPNRSAHQALRTLREGLMTMSGGWVLDVDIQQFFDSLDHEHMRSFLDKRVRDGVLRRAVGKWLNAGVLEDGKRVFPDEGTPQGGVISPLLANIYLHHVLDEWFEREIKPRLAGKAVLVRYADDFVIVFSSEQDARRVLDVLPKRFGRYGLTLHPEKTRLVPFRRPRAHRVDAAAAPGSFDFLGMTFHWAQSRKGSWVVKRRTAKSRFTRALRSVSEWCRRHRHDPVRDQHATLTRKLRGHDEYYGIAGNYDALRRFHDEVASIWQKWLSRRSAQAAVSWVRMKEIFTRFPLPRPRVRHADV